MYLFCGLYYRKAHVSNVFGKECIHIGRSYFFVVDGMVEGGDQEHGTHKHVDYIVVKDCNIETHIQKSEHKALLDSASKPLIVFLLLLCK